MAHGTGDSSMKHKFLVKAQPPGWWVADPTPTGQGLPGSFSVSSRCCCRVMAWAQGPWALQRHLPRRAQPESLKTEGGLSPSDGAASEVVSSA